jgi:dihydroorotase-like cyclic amidohydrolase
MEKLGFIAEKIFTLEVSGPVRGIILVLNERIFDVVQYSESVSFAQIKELHSDWNPVIYENSCICPGLIEISARSEWDSETVLSKMAASGGVTFMCLEKNMHWETPGSTERFTDIGYIGDINDIYCERDGDSSKVIAYKGYLSEPCKKVNKMLSELLSNSDLLQSLEKPLIIDPILPTERQLFQVSPCRKLTLTERINFDSEKTDRHFSCAFPDELPSFKDQKIAPSEDQEEVPISPASTVETLRKNSKLSEAIHRRLSLNSIYDDLEEKIRENQADLSNLSLLEEQSYSNSGLTISDLRNRSNSCNDEIYKNHDSPNESFSERLDRRRPTPISIKPSLSEREDLKYLPFVAKVAETWEVNGIRQVLSSFSGPVHFSKLSSAAAVNYLRKMNNPLVTCDVSACQLFLNENNVTGSIFKDFPPIRSEKNQRLLWELLKLGDLQVVSSHHVTVPLALKQMGGGSFLQSLNGILSLGLAFQMLWTRALEWEESEKTDESVQVIFEALSLSPAKVLKVDQDRGSISKGKFADLVIWKPFEDCPVRDFSAVGKSPFSGKGIKGKVETVFVRGQQVFCHDSFKCL